MSSPGVAAGTLDSVSGATTVTIQHQKVGIIWRIYQLTVKAVSSPVLTVEIFVNTYQALSTTVIVNGQAASGDPPIDIGYGDTMTVDLTTGITGDPVVVTYFYDELYQETG